MKPLCYMLLWAWRSTTLNSIPIILIPLTNKNAAWNYSVAICQQKTKDCAPSVSFQHKLQHCGFYIWCLLSFITSLMLRGLCWFCWLCWFVMVASVVLVVFVPGCWLCRLWWLWWLWRSRWFWRAHFLQKAILQNTCIRQTNILLKAKALILK